MAELDESVRLLRSEGAGEVILLKCTSTYPADPKESYLLTIPHLRDLFDLEVGLSDHTLGIGVALGSVALGVRVIEKHVTLSCKEGGVDASFSIGIDEMKRLVEESYRVWESLGRVFYGMTEGGKKSAIFRRSIYTIRDIKKGEVFTPNNIGIIRPGDGLAPGYYNILLGKKSSCDLSMGTPFCWDFL